MLGNSHVSMGFVHGGRKSLVYCWLRCTITVYMFDQREGPFRPIQRLAELPPHPAPLPRAQAPTWIQIPDAPIPGRSFTGLLLLSVL